MPQPLSRRGVESDQAIREEIHPVTIAAVEVGFRRFGRDVNNPALFVQRLTGPRHEAGSGFVSVDGPGVVTQFSRTGYQMEYPAALTGSDIKGANRSWTAKASDDQKILIGD